MAKIIWVHIAPTKGTTRNDVLCLEKSDRIDLENNYSLSQ